MVRIFTDPRCLEHGAPPGYPERPDRLERIVEHLRTRAWPFADLSRAPVGEEAVLALHEERYVRRFERAVSRGDSLLDSADNPLTPGTWEASWAAVATAPRAWPSSTSTSTTAMGRSTSSRSAPTSSTPAPTSTRSIQGPAPRT